MEIVGSETLTRRLSKEKNDLQTISRPLLSRKSVAGPRRDEDWQLDMCSAKPFLVLFRSYDVPPVL